MLKRITHNHTHTHTNTCSTTSWQGVWVVGLKWKSICTYISFWHYWHLKAGIFPNYISNDNVSKSDTCIYRMRRVNGVGSYSAICYSRCSWKNPEKSFRILFCHCRCTTLLWFHLPNINVRIFYLLSLHYEHSIKDI